MKRQNSRSNTRPDPRKNNAKKTVRKVASVSMRQVPIDHDDYSHEWLLFSEGAPICTSDKYYDPKDAQMSAAHFFKCNLDEIAFSIEKIKIRKVWLDDSDESDEYQYCWEAINFDGNPIEFETDDGDIERYFSVEDAKLAAADFYNTSPDGLRFQIDSKG